MRTSDFHFELPPELKAEYPSEERDKARLMVIDRKTNKIKHLLFKDIVEYFDQGDTLILNDTKVFPGRLFGRKEKTDAEIEVLITRIVKDGNLDTTVDRMLDTSLKTILRDRLDEKLKNHLKANLKAVLKDAIKDKLVDRLAETLKNKGADELDNKLRPALRGMLDNQLEDTLKGKLDKELEEKLVYMLKDMLEYLLDNKLMDCIVDPARKVRVGNKIYFGDPKSPVLVAEVQDNTTSRGRTLKFLSNESHAKFKETLRSIGLPPLPKYIKRETELSDNERYQTIYAREDEFKSSVAAPTAGLHFSKHVLKRLEIKGVNIAKITLHIGLGTFTPVEVEDLSKHRMDSEEYSIPPEACEMINNSLKNKKRICSVGTSSMRAIESAVFANHQLSSSSLEKESWTNKFIFPPYNFKIANTMVTNFHMPKSTLLMLVSAFTGHDLMMRAYREAIEEKYRFYSYGDAMLIL